ncbi:hypothetical protein M9Y10_034140 [Tritrichomonas musculus]|uniref:Guanylate cyclase domain-containing protein n=1 Tax=Tritrichomonas musculus TaxID=1915356 RepID=A0ABR2KE39_9EUKA
MKNVLQKHEEEDDLLYEDDEPKFEELRFKDILDVSLIKMNFYRSSKYFSKINCHIGPPPIVYYIHIFLTFMQLISPCLILNSIIIWKPDSIISFILQIIFTVSRGWYSSCDDYPRRIITITCVFIILVFDFLLEFLKHRFQSRQIVSDMESNIVISIYKYLIPHLYPFLLCGFPGAVKNLSYGHHNFLNYFDVIIGPLFFIYEMIKYFDLTKRVLFENNHSFSLNSNLLPLTIMTISINNAIDCAIIPPEKSTFRIILLLILFLIYLFNGIVYSIFIPNISRIYSFLYSSTCLSCSICVIIDLFCIYLDISINFFILIAFVILALIFYFVNSFITNMSMLKYTQIFDEMNNFSENEIDEFSSIFKNKISFYRAMYISFSYWDPYFFSWKPFRLALEKWPESSSILIFWAKIVSIFPKESRLFEQLTIKILQNQKISLTYRLQFRYIIHTRIATMIPSLKAFFASFDKASQHAKNMYKIFFENILSKNTTTFWKNVADVSKQVKNLDFALQKNIDSYPNNIEVISYYCHFLQTIKLDLPAYIEWKKKFELLKNGKKLKNDLPYTAALPVYPQLVEINGQTEEFVNHNDDSDIATSEAENDDQDNANNDQLKEDDENQLKLNLAMMIKSSKIGRILIPSIFIIIGTIIVLLGFFGFLYLYNDKFVSFFYDAFHDINNIDNSILNCARLEFFTSQLVTLFGNKTNRTDIVRVLAPSFSGRNNAIPPWTFGEEEVISMATETRDYIKNLPFYFGHFEVDFDSIISENDHSIVLRTIENLIELIEKSPLKLLDIDEPVYNEFIIAMDNFFPKLIEASSELVDNNSDDNSLKTMNNLMTAVLLVDILFISVPYIFCFFSLGLLSHDISQSFLSLQVSAVCEVISKITVTYSSLSDSSFTKPEESNLNKVLPTQQGSNYSSTSVYMILFVLTFAPISSAFLAIHFYSHNFTIEGESELKALQDITYPVSFMYYLSYLYTEVYNNKFIYEGNDSRTNLFIEKGKNCVNIINFVLINGLFGTGKSLNIIQNYLPAIMARDSDQSVVLTELESLFKSSYIGTIDLLNSMLILEFNETDELAENDTFFNQFSYYLTNWAIENRDKPFFTSLFTSIRNRVKRHFSYIIPLFVVVVIFQVLIVILAIFALLSNLQYFKSALNFFLFFKPSLILQNEQITGMICEGRVKSDSNHINFKNSEKILVNIPESVVILDKRLSIIDHNKAFNKLVAVSEPLIGKNLTHVMLYRKCDGQNIDHLERRLNNILKGKEEPHFDMNFSFLTIDNNSLFVTATVISLSQKGPINNESQFKQIIMIALVIDDQTQKTLDHDQILSEQIRIEKVLENVMPLPIVEEVNNSTESISFSVQSVTIGNIFVETDPFNTSEDSEAPFRFYDEIFHMFDECLKNHLLVTKIKSFMKIYTFSCGLFDEQVKPERMAEEATRFALSIIQLQRHFEEKLKRRITLCIGLDSGGPAVAGFVSLNRPNFMVIGNVADLALSMALTGIPGKVQISENVQELIYLYNFNIQERGEVLSINGSRTKSFFVTN